MVKIHILYGPLRKPASETSGSTPRDSGNASGGLKYCAVGGRVIYPICQVLIIPECGVHLSSRTAVGDKWSSHP